MTKKKPLMLMIIIAVIIVCIFCFYPQQFSSIISENDTISVVYIQMPIQNGELNMDSTVFEFTKDTDGYSDIVNLFGQYNYHRTLMSLFKSTGMEYKNRGVDYIFNIYICSPDQFKDITMGGDGRLIVKEHLYKMGFWGNKTQVEFMEQLRNVLENNQHAIQAK